MEQVSPVAPQRTVAPPEPSPKGVPDGSHANTNKMLKARKISIPRKVLKNEKNRARVGCTKRGGVSRNGVMWSGGSGEEGV